MLASMLSSILSPAAPVLSLPGAWLLILKAVIFALISAAAVPAVTLAFKSVMVAVGIAESSLAFCETAARTIANLPASSSPAVSFAISVGVTLVKSTPVNPRASATSSFRVLIVSFVTPPTNAN